MRYLYTKRSFQGLVMVLLLAIALPLSAQRGSKPFLISVFNTGSQLPGSGALGVFTTPIHPGMMIGTEIFYNKHLANHWFQTARLGAFHHKHAQTALQIYTEAGYRRIFGRHFGTELRLGGGYVLAAPHTEVFELVGDVYQEKMNPGRSMAMLGGAFGLSYLPNYPFRKLRFFLDYQFALQLPFVREYVPMLPYTSLHLGTSISLARKK